MLALAQRLEAAAASEGVRDAALDEITNMNGRYHASLSAAADSLRLQRLLDAVVQLPVARRRLQHCTDEGAAAEACGITAKSFAALSLRDGEWAVSVMRARILAAQAVRLRSAAADMPPASAEPVLPQATGT